MQNMDGQVARLSIKCAVEASRGSEALVKDDVMAELEWVNALFCEVVILTCVSAMACAIVLMKRSLWSGCWTSAGSRSGSFMIVTDCFSGDPEQLGCA